MTAETWWIPKGSQAKDWPLWRYMDLASYLELLRSGSLWLTRCDRFEDPCEGRFNPPTIEAMVRSFEHAPDRGAGMSEMAKRLEEDIETTYINCWHCSSRESLAMWRLYSKNYYCIAIRSTFRKLIAALPDWAAVTFVEYIDWDKQVFADHHQSQCMFRVKRLEFAHEREVRVVHSSPLHKGPDINARPEGIAVAVDLSSVIESAWVEPRTPEFVTSAVTGITRQFQYDWPVKRSLLLDKPA